MLYDLISSNKPAAPASRSLSKAAPPTHQYQTRSSTRGAASNEVASGKTTENVPPETASDNNNNAAQTNYIASGLGGHSEMASGKTTENVPPETASDNNNNAAQTNNERIEEFYRSSRAMASKWLAGICEITAYPIVMQKNSKVEIIFVFLDKNQNICKCNKAIVGFEPHIRIFYPDEKLIMFSGMCEFDSRNGGVFYEGIYLPDLERDEFTKCMEVQFSVTDHQEGCEKLICRNIVCADFRPEESDETSWRLARTFPASQEYIRGARVDASFVQHNRDSATYSVMPNVGSKTSSFSQHFSTAEENKNGTESAICTSKKRSRTVPTVDCTSKPATTRLANIAAWLDRNKSERDIDININELYSKTKRRCDHCLSSYSSITGPKYIRLACEVCKERTSTYCVGCSSDVTPVTLCDRDNSAIGRESCFYLYHEYTRQLVTVSQWKRSHKKFDGSFDGNRDYNRDLMKLLGNYYEPSIVNEVCMLDYPQIVKCDSHSTAQIACTELAHCSDTVRTANINSWLKSFEGKSVRTMSKEESKTREIRQFNHCLSSYSSITGSSHTRPACEVCKERTSTYCVGCSSDVTPVTLCDRENSAIGRESCFYLYHEYTRQLVTVSQWKRSHKKFDGSFDENRDYNSLHS